MTGRDQESAENDGKPTVLRRVLKWVPLGLAVLLVLGGGLAVATAPMGHDEDLAAQQRLLTTKRAEAEAAEKELAGAYDTALDDASVVSPARLHSDDAAIRALFEAIVVDRDADELLAEHKIDKSAPLAKFAANVRSDGVPGVTGEVTISQWTPVLTRISTTDYTWFVTAEVGNGDGTSRTVSLSLTADSNGTFHKTEAHWGAP